MISYDRSDDRSSHMFDDYERSIMQQADGRCLCRLIPADGDPAKWQSDGHSYLTYEDADRLARLFLAAKLLPR
jgi:hypothetical protein